MELARQKDNDKDKYNKKDKKTTTKTNQIRKTKNNDKDKFNKKDKKQRQIQ